jgi:hypothetical protein
MSPQSKAGLAREHLTRAARKDAGYEGEDPEFGDWTSEELVSTVEDAVHTAEEAAHAAPDEDEDAEREEAASPPEESSP